VILVALAASACAGSSCRRNTTAQAAPEVSKPKAVSVETAVAVEEPLARFLSVSGTLMAQEQAEVAAEVAGRVVGTPVERGTPVAAGSVLVSIAATEMDAQAREADANVAQIEARLGQAPSEGFDVERVPEVAVARANRDLAKADFERVRTLYERKLVSKAENDMRQAQAESAERQYESARNAVEQQRQQLVAAQARQTLARKAVADTVVRAPFTGVVAERQVSIGDYVTRGTKVATVMRINPLRVELTVPAQYISSVGQGRSVALQMDSYPGQTFTGQVRYVSPGVRADSRALIVEAVVDNPKGLLKPGLFVTARIEQTAPTPGVLVPASAVQTAAGTSRVYVVVEDHVEERIVTTGQPSGDRVEITSGLKPTEVVAVGATVTKLADGTPIVRSAGTR
jgi:multidrug efflux pump subunit AcrA (membrane-fusion protein)